MPTRLLTLLFLAALPLATPAADPDPSWLSFAGKEGAGKGKKVVLIASAPEYDPQGGLPLLAKVLATHHGFDCTVLYSVNKAGEIAPDGNDIPGLDALDKADLLVILTRFRALPDEQMKHIVDYLEAGKPVIGLRTATHAFAYPGNSKSEYRKYSWDNKDKEFNGGFGRQVLGETWITHHAPNGSTSTRGIFAPGAADSPILKGIKEGEIWGTTGVYGLRLPLVEGCKTLLLGEVVQGNKPDGKAAAGKPNDPMMPIAWTRTYSVKEGSKGRALCTTMGSSEDIQNEAFRRFLVNGCYWAVGMEDKIPAKADVTLVGKPVQYKKGMKPSAYAD